MAAMRLIAWMFVWWVGIETGLAVSATPARATPGRTAAESRAPQWPRQPAAPRGAPNVLVVLTDDVGFGASSTFGGAVSTPTLDALARDGLRFNRFHTTAICSSTRASLLTGRNPHNVGMGTATNVAGGYPGYNSVIPRSAATVARILRDHGYGTAMFGKAHITPDWELGPTGPFDRWPTGLGFDYYYGFLGADTSMFEPALVENTRFIERPRNGKPYHFDADIADQAIRWIHDQTSIAPERPMFIYLATGGAHAPHHAPPEWLARFRGQFDAGWDATRQQTFLRQKELGVIPANAVLTPRPSLLQPWSSLDAGQQRVAARMMEAYAANLAFADAQIGRVVETLRTTDPDRPPLVIYIQGDNGSSPEGGSHGLLYEQSQINNVAESPGYQLAHIDEIGTARAYNAFPAAWGWALNSPFQWYKRIGSHFGGTRNGLVISWPGHVADPGAVRTQFHFVSDIAPTILEAAGIEPPASVDGVLQQPFDGISMAYTFTSADGPGRRTTQLFEQMQNIAIYENGWIASTTPTMIPWDLERSPRTALRDRAWELYEVDKDFSQAHDLSTRDPARLARLQQRFWDEAAHQKILPIRTLNEGREGIPDPAAGRREFNFHSGQVRIPENSGAPPVSGRPFRIDADTNVPAGGGNGVIVAQGGRFGGYALYLKSGVLSFHYNALGPNQFIVRSAARVPPGQHRLTVKFVPDSPQIRAGGTVTLYVDETTVASGRIDKTLRRISHTEGLDIGRDALTAVSEEYVEGDNAFDGEIFGVRYTLL